MRVFFLSFLLILTILTSPFNIYAGENDDIFKDPATLIPKDPKNFQYAIDELPVDFPAFFIIPSDRKSIDLIFSKEGGKKVSLKLFNTINGWLTNSGIILSNGTAPIGLIIDFTTGNIYEMPNTDLKMFESLFSFEDALLIKSLQTKERPELFANVIAMDAAKMYSRSELKFLPNISIVERPKLDPKVNSVISTPYFNILINKDNLRKDVVLGKDIITAASTGQHDRLLSLLSLSRSNINELDELTGDNALIRAVYSGQSGSANILIKNGIDVNHRNRSGQSALHVASDLGLYDVVEALIKAGATINSRDNSGNSPIIYASVSPNAKVVDLLNKNGANVNDTNSIGETPLLIAATLGNTETIKTLISNGAKLNTVDTNSNTPLIKAVEQGNKESIELLLDLGADPNVSNNNGYTPLHVAMDTNNLNIMELLLESGANIDVKNNDGNTPLMIATKKGNYDLVNFLLNYNPDLNITNSKGHSVFILARNDDSARIANRLLAALRVSDEINTTLYKYVGSNDILNVEITVGKGADVNTIENTTGNTPIFIAIANKYDFLVAKLLELGAAPDYQNDRGNTPLMVAVATGRVDIVNNILKYSTNPDLANNDGDTALMLSVRLKNTDMVKRILLAGADPNKKNFQNMSAYTMAYRDNNQEVLTVLKTAGGRL